MQSENQTFNYIFIVVFKQLTNFLMQLEQIQQIKQTFFSIKGWLGIREGEEGVKEAANHSKQESKFENKLDVDPSD